MKRFKNILLVCHFDAKQHMAVERAVSLARQNEARLTVFSAVRELPADVHMATTGLLSLSGLGGQTRETCKIQTDSGRCRPERDYDPQAPAKI